MRISVLLPGHFSCVRRAPRPIRINVRADPLIVRVDPLNIRMDPLSVRVDAPCWPRRRSSCHAARMLPAQAGAAPAATVASWVTPCA
eukprot:977301-Pyramimonas_sp.AAC.1